MWFMWCNLDGGESQFILDLVYDININLHPKVYIWFNLSISSVYFIFIIFVSVWLLTIFRLFTTLRSLQLSSLHEEPWHLRGRLFIALFVEAMFSIDATTELYDSDNGGYRNDAMSVNGIKIPKFVFIGVTSSKSNVIHGHQLVPLFSPMLHATIAHLLSTLMMLWTT